MAWHIDPSHSQIEFVVRHMMITNVRGTFKAFSGLLAIDERNPQASHVEATFDVATLETGDEKRNAHLRSADFFDVEKFPTMTFKSKRVEFPAPGSLDNFKIIGDLTIRDVTREVVLEASNEGKNKNPWGMQVWGFNAHLTINRKDWGLMWNVALETGGLLVGEQVKINIELQAVYQPETVATGATETAQA
jgi:polyisoprenoid-binding protein YceI